LVPDQLLAFSQLGDTENHQLSLLGNSKSWESREEDEEVDEEDIERDKNIHGACDETALNSSIEPSFFVIPLAFFYPYYSLYPLFYLFSVPLLFMLYFFVVFLLQATQTRKELPIHIISFKLE
jgi:hypothetical protein